MRYNGSTVVHYFDIISLLLYAVWWVDRSKLLRHHIISAVPGTAHAIVQLSLLIFRRVNLHIVMYKPVLPVEFIRHNLRDQQVAPMKGVKQVNVLIQLKRCGVYNRTTPSLAMRWAVVRRATERKTEKLCLRCRNERAPRDLYRAVLYTQFLTPRSIIAPLPANF